MRPFIITLCLAGLILAPAVFADPLEIAYDDGSRIYSTNLQAPQRGGVLFQPSSSTYPFQVLYVRIWFSTPGTFQAHLLTSTTLGASNGDDEVTPFSYNATEIANWDTIDFSSYNIVLSEDFMFAGLWQSVVPRIWCDGSGSGHFWRDNGLGWITLNTMDPLIRATIETNTGVQIELPPTPLIDGFQLSEIYPNPWNSEARIQLQITTPQQLRLDLIDILGRRVQSIFQGTMNTGIYNLTLRSDQLSSGTYWITAQTPNGIITSRPTVLIK